MFSITREGIINRDLSWFCAAVNAAIPPPRDCRGSTPESRIAAILVPHFVASGLEPSTQYTYELHFVKFKSWAEVNIRPSLPASINSVSIYLTLLTLRQNSPCDVLAARLAINS